MDPKININSITARAIGRRYRISVNSKLITSLALERVYIVDITVDGFL